MLQIALCDDEPAQLELTKALLKEYRHTRPELDLRTTTFAAAALLEHLRVNGNFDLYFLDILMPGMNGIELGVKIRMIDSGGRILYLTTSTDYAIDSYRAKASGYLLKPVRKECLFPILDEAVENWLGSNQAYVTIKTRDGLQRCPIRAVVFSELVGRCVHYHLVDGSMLEGVSVHTSFREAVADLLSHDRFVLCSASLSIWPMLTGSTPLI